MIALLQRHCTAVADIWSMGVMAVEMAEGQNPYAKYKNILAAIHGIPKDPPPELSDGPNPDVIDLDLPAAGAGATSPPLKPSTATSDKPGTANSSRADRKWSDAFRAFIRDMLVKDPTKRPPAMQAIHEEFVSGDIRLFSENHGRHPALRELARRYADVASRVRDEFLNSTGGRFGYDTEALGSQFDTFDLFSTQVRPWVHWCPMFIVRGCGGGDTMFVFLFVWRWARIWDRKRSCMNSPTGRALNGLEYSAHARVRSVRFGHV